MKIDQLMIREFLGDSQVGIYSAAVRLSESLYFLPVVISNSLFPAIMNAKSRDQNQYNERIKKLYF
jgi:O-antigen/teichoic acid export membrane protein